eukprot:PhF_6_TR32976/c0_g1_i1/m.48559
MKHYVTSPIVLLLVVLLVDFLLTASTSPQSVKQHWQSTPTEEPNHFHRPVLTVPPPPPTKYSHDEDWLQINSYKYYCSNYSNIITEKLNITKNDYCPQIFFPQGILDPGFQIFRNNSNDFENITIRRLFCDSTCLMTMKISFPSDRSSYSSITRIEKVKNVTKYNKCICSRGGNTMILFGVRTPCPSSISSVEFPKQIIQHKITDLDKIETISKFRSSCGHDQSDCFESCRSMKHYFSAYSIDRRNQHVPLFLPFASRVVGFTCTSPECERDFVDQRIYFCSLQYPMLCGRYHHIDPNPNVEWRVGLELAPGTLMGHGRFNFVHRHGSAFDVGFELHLLNATKYISLFDLMDDHLFEDFKSWSPLQIKSKDSFIVSKEWRDAHPFKCIGSKFLTKNHSDWIPSFVLMSCNEQFQPSNPKCLR